ncbi:hypothetical protein D477_016015 [Arthrobacter crystallopoietes BAB-32]|uniref:Acyl-CoA carboxylase subunit epsilon n=1 Tax=Arthrobacter crystallopoietes BAB-32 TaxID=1246476 RepID=N1US29_9MICC|nr:acyl-CoA carboxylase subunit epsilon [Arthrobacter crystallopoietes]EMY33216.1 hypothetical protein D477_016015 [Arthrobacter crystallopoietes BAB-32]
MTETQHLPAAAAAPLFTIAKGDPTPEELAAVTAVVLALQPAAEPAETTERRTRPRNPRRRELLRPVVAHGPGAWRHTFR